MLYKQLNNAYLKCMYNKLENKRNSLIKKKYMNLEWHCMLLLYLFLYLKSIQEHISKIN